MGSAGGAVRGVRGGRRARTRQTGNYNYVCLVYAKAYYLSLASFSSAMVDLQSSREAELAQGPPSATERRECKSRVTLLLTDADSGQIDHMAAEHTHGPHQPCTSSSWLGARDILLAIANVSGIGGSKTLRAQRSGHSHRGMLHARVGQIVTLH